MRIYMQTIPNTGQTPKFFHLHLEPDLFEGWILTKESGAQGSKGRVKMTHFKDINDAENTFEKLRDAQIKRGYQIVFIEGQTNPSQPEQSN